MDWLISLVGVVGRLAVRFHRSVWLGGWLVNVVSFVGVVSWLVDAISSVRVVGWLVGTFSTAELVDWLVCARDFIGRKWLVG